jgi:hypothetical protein
MSEPVEYQYRTRPDWIPEWNGWNTCSKESAQAYEKTPYLHDWHYEVRRLYITPPQRTWVGLTDEDELDWDGGDLKSLVKAIEAKLKEKNT